jgi:hypothetical protein
MIGSRAWVGLAVGAALIAAQASAAELVVVEARGITLKPGEIVDERQKLALQPGDELTLVDERGSVMKLRGPFNGPPASGKGSSIDISNALAALGTGGTQNSVGVVRANVATVTLPSPWLIDVTHTGEACVRPGTPMVFWRQQSTDQATLRISPAGGAWHAESDWPAGASELSAPAMLPVVDGQDYAFDLDGETATVTLVHVPASLHTDRMRAAWMLQKNCVSQAKALIATIK